MATIRRCPIYPKWDSYQPLLNGFRNIVFLFWSHFDEAEMKHSHGSVEGAPMEDDFGTEKPSIPNKSWLFWLRK